MKQGVDERQRMKDEGTEAWRARLRPKIEFAWRHMSDDGARAMTVTHEQ
jgi:hypothetical protein